MRRPIASSLLLIAALAAPAAFAKDFRTTVCAADGCKPARPALSGVATARGDVLPPKAGRFFVVRLGPGEHALCLLHERTRGLVRALDDGTAATLGRRWRRLTAEQRAHYAVATAGRTAFSSPRTAAAARTLCQTRRSQAP